MARFTVYQTPSLSVRGNQIFFLITLCISFAITFVCVWHGLWLVIPFAGIEMLALGLALYFCLSKLSRVETITIADKNIEVCIRQRNKIKQSRLFPKAWSRAFVCPSPRTKHRQQLWLGVNQLKMEIGEPLDDSEKYQLARAINKAIHQT